MADDEVAAGKAAVAEPACKVLPNLEDADPSEDQVKLVKRWLDDMPACWRKRR